MNDISYCKSFRVSKRCFEQLITRKPREGSAQDLNSQEDDSRRETKI